MSRFSNLEFNDDSGEEFASTPLVKDEAYYLSEAEMAFANGEFAQGLRSFAKVLEHNPNNAAAWTGQVRMLIELGEFREARLWADKAIERFPHEPELLAAKAVALARLGDIENALAFSDAAVEERGDTAYIWLARGDVLLAAKQKQAVSCIEQAVVRGCNWLVHWLASRIYFHYKKLSLALKMAQQGVALDAGRCVLWLQLGQCQAALGLAGAATNSFEQAVELNPQCHAAVVASSKMTHAGVLRRLGRWCRGLVYR